MNLDQTAHRSDLDPYCLQKSAVFIIIYSRITRSCQYQFNAHIKFGYFFFKKEF